MKYTFFDQSKLDLLERILVIIFYFFLLIRLLQAYLETGNEGLIIFLFDQFLILFFTLIRINANTISLKFSDWLIAVMGTIFPLLMGPLGDNAILSATIALPVMLTGMCLHLVSKIYLRRSFGIVPALREIKSLGPYRIIRHPIYAGYMIVQAALFLSGPTFYNFCITSVSWVLFILRIVAEEKILLNDPEYQKLIKQTPYRLIPYVY